MKHPFLATTFWAGIATLIASYWLTQYPALFPTAWTLIILAILFAIGVSKKKEDEDE